MPEVTLIVPLTSFRSSFPTIPFVLVLVTLRVPFPLNVRSSLEYIAPSTVLSSISTLSELIEIVFVVPSAKVTNTLSACFT